MDVVAGKRMKVQKIGKPKVVSNSVEKGMDEWRGLQFSVDEENMVWLKICFVGKAHFPDTVHLLQDRLIEEGLLTIYVKPLGGSKVLLQSFDGEDLKDLINKAKSILEIFFSDIVQ